MKFNRVAKVFVVLCCCGICCLISVSPSRAEQPFSNLSKQLFSAEDLKTIEGYQGNEDVTPGMPPEAASKDAAAFDVKVSLSDRFKAFVSVGDHTVKDLAGRDTGQNYSTVVGFQIILK